MQLEGGPLKQPANEGRGGERNVRRTLGQAIDLRTASACRFLLDRSIQEDEVAVTASRRR